MKIQYRVNRIKTQFSKNEQSRVNYATEDNFISSTGHKIRKLNKNKKYFKRSNFGGHKFFRIW